MAIELITGHAGEAHVSSADAGAYHAGTAGSGRYILQTANQLAASMADANTITIATGDALFDGRHVRLTSPESAVIDSGTQGQQRNDIVGIEYALSGGIETASLAVIKGTPAASGAVDPDLPTGNILEGATEAFMPLYRVRLDGINAGTPQLMADVLPSIVDAQESADEAASAVAALARVAGHNHVIPSGAFQQSRNIVLFRQGNIVTASLINAVTPNSAGTQLNCGTIPVAYRPQQSVFQSGRALNNADFVADYRWSVNTTGAVSFISSATIIQEAPLSMSWYTAQPFPS